MDILPLLLLLAVPALRAEHPMCRRMRPLARKMKLNYAPSNNYYSNCGPGSYGSSNYTFAVDPDDPMEVHVVGVHEGSFPPGAEFKGPKAPKGSVRVFVYKTKKPVLLVLSAYKSVLWDITITQDALVDRVVLQGHDHQEILGVPEDIPVIRRPYDQACGYAYGWEDRRNRYGGAYRKMIQSLRCTTGLRETSFQGCYSGAVFEIPYYRKGPRPKKIVDWSPPCPIDMNPNLTAAAPKKRSWLRRKRKRSPKPPRREPPSSVLADYPKAQLPGTKQSLPRPAGPSHGEKPYAPEQESSVLPSDKELDAAYGALPSGPKTDLLRPRTAPAHRDIPVRALAILLEGNHALLTHDAVPDLIIALKKGNVILRSRAAEMLGRLGPAARSAVKPLIKALKDDSPRVRSSAALALGNIGTAARRAVPYIKKALRSKYADIRVSAETALKRIGTPKALKALRKHRQRKGYAK